MMLSAALVVALCWLHCALGHVDITSPASGTATAEEGGYVTLMCECSEGHDVQWLLHAQFGDIVIEGGPPFVITASSTGAKTTSLLSIEDVTSDDAGEYSCEDVRDSENRDTIQLIVTAQGAGPPADWVSPTFEKRGDSQAGLEVEIGKEMRLKCIGGRAGATLAFRRDDTTIQINTYTLITQAENLDTPPVVEAILSVEPVESSHAGTYTCFDEDYPDVQDRLEVLVVDHPTTQVEIIEPSGTHSKVMVGSNFNLKCQASLQTNIEWYKGSSLLENEVNGFIIGESEDAQGQTKYSILTKEGAERGDSGEYRCVNADTDTDEASIVVNVKEKGDEDDDGDDGGFFDGMFGGCPRSVASSTLAISILTVISVLWAKL